MSMTDSEFLNSYGGDTHPSFKFAEVGDTIRGIVAETPKVVDTTNLSNGQPEKKLIVPVTNDEGQTFAVWIGKGFAAKAVKEAIAEAGVTGLAEGGQFTMKLVELRDTGKPSKAKVYKAKYVPPAPSGVGVDELL